MSFKAALLGGMLAAAPGQTAETPALPVVTSGETFWVLSNEAKTQALPLRMELTVYYYDSAWKLLYGRAGDLNTYLPVHGRSLPMRSGQRVLLEGTVVPAEGFDGDRIKVSIQGEGAWPTALPTAGRVHEAAILNGQWVEMEGYVVGQNEPDPTHVQARLWCEGHAVQVIIQISGFEPVPQLIGARVRVRGVYDASIDQLGNIQKIQLWTLEPARHLEVRGWMAEDERFRLPRTALDQLGVTTQPWVRVVGELRAQEPGKSITLRDETGQSVIATTQPETLPLGATVEVVGRPGSGEIGWTVHEPLFRLAATTPGTRLSAPVPGQVPLWLRLAEQVLQLTPDLAEKRYPLTLRGVVTWAAPRANFFYVQDTSGGVRVNLPAGSSEAPESGTSLVLQGKTVRGAYVPEVEMLEATVQGTMALPPARRVTLEQALTGAEEGQRVEMRGFVRRTVAEGGWTRLDLTTFTGEFSAYLPPGDDLSALRGALVRIRGVCSALTNANREVTDIRLWLQGREDILVDEPAPADPFTQPLETIQALRQYTSAQLIHHRVRLAGVVLLQEPGRYLYVQDEDGGLLVLTRETTQVRPGDRVEVVGYPGRAGNRLVIRDGTWRPAAAGPAISPRSLTEVKEPMPGADARLVQLKAVLRQAVAEGSVLKLTLQAGDTVFDATLRNATGWVVPGAGSQLELTGVYVLEFAEDRQPHGFRLEMRSPADVRLLATPPWWTARRTWAAVIGLFGIIVLIVGWGVTLRRRVREQTEQIRRQLEKEARLQAELERSSRLESLGVLAGGIAHDFNNLLTAILGNLGLAAMDKRVMAAAGDCISEAERGARRARDITQQLLTFAKGGDPVRTAVLLPDVISEAAGFAPHGSNVRFDFNYPPDLPPGNVDAGQISRVVHNLVINAVQAMPDGGVVSISLAAVNLAPGEVGALAAGAYLRLTIADTGKGIPAEHLPRIFDPYFSTKSKAGNSGLGLATVRSIIRKHSGHIEVESVVGRGTTFRIWLPVAPHEAETAKATGPGTSAQGPARILVMDDEDVIRRVAGRMLALAGHEAVFAADGAEAVRLYTAARHTVRPFDLVIFDLTVPGGMGGKEAVQELLKIDADLRAIASSGYSNDPIMANPKAYGFRSRLAKPYDIPDLVQAIDEVRRA